MECVADPMEPVLPAVQRVGAAAVWDLLSLDPGGFAAVFVGHQYVSQETVVRSQVGAVGRHQQDQKPLGAHAGVDHGQVDAIRRKVGARGAQEEGSVGHVLRWHLVG